MNNTDLENVLCTHWKQAFSELEKHPSQGYKSTVYNVKDSDENRYLLKAVPAGYWSSQDEAAIISQARLGSSRIMPKVYPVADNEMLYLRDDDQYLLLQEMVNGREADIDSRDDFKRTINLLDRLHDFPVSELPLKEENPLDYLTSKKFNEVLGDVRFKSRFSPETIAAVYKVFTSAGMTRAPKVNPEALVIVHGDIKTEHVLLGDDISQDRLIDCDTMHLGLPEEDYARLLTPGNIGYFLETGKKIDLQALAYHQHLFLLGELSSAVNGMTTYADRMNMPESFVQEQSDRIERIVPERMEEMALIARAIRMSGFQQPLNTGDNDKSMTVSKPKN